MEKSIFCHPYFKKLYVYTVQITKSSLTIEYFIINEFYFDYIRFMDITRDKLGLDGTVNGVEPLHLFNYGTFLFIHGLYLLVF